VGCSFAITTRTENKHRGTVAYAAHNSEETANEAAPKEGEASCSAHNQAKPEAGRPAVTATGYAGRRTCVPPDVRTRYRNSR
jgi:hypothetical protein